MEFFPFLGLTNNEDLLTSLFLVLANLATTAPSIPSSCHLSRQSTTRQCSYSSLQSALCPLQFPTSTFFYASVLIPSIFIYSPLVSFPFIFFRHFPLSPAGDRRKWEEDVEERGFSFARTRLTPTPKGERRTETIVSVGA